MKRLFSLLLFGLLIGLAAAEPKVPQLTGRVVDQAKIFGASGAEKIDAAIRALETATGGGQMAVLTVDTLDGTPIEEFGIRVMDQWKIGRKGKDDGAILIIALRDRAMLELMYGSGLRASELCALEIQAVNFEEGVLRVRGKGSKDRVVPVGRKALEALRDYLSENGRAKLAKPRTGSALFLSSWGKAISRKTLWALLQERVRRAGIDKKIHPHQLRHAFATHLLANGADLRVIQELLGHADIGTTQIYTAVERSRLADEHRRTHPRGQA